MGDNAQQDLQNVIVMALIDKTLSAAEEQFIGSLRAKLGIDEATFRRICREVREDRSRLSLPRDPAKAVELLRQVALADGQISEAEQRILDRLVEQVGATATASQQERLSVELELPHLLDEIYEQFSGWSDTTQREKLDQFASAGTPAVIPLLQILESYRMPEGAADTLALKALVCQQLGRLGDDRAVYYLCQQISLGDAEDEINSADLRYAATEALGRIIGQPFPPDAQGVQAAREWWLGPGRAKYDHLAF